MERGEVRLYAGLATLGALFWSAWFLAEVSGRSVAELVTGDDRWYVRMAENPFSFVPSPFGFGFRVLTPLLVWALGNVHWGFPLVNGAASVTLLLVFYRFLREFYAVPASLMGTGFLFFSGTARNLVCSPYATDALPHLAVVWALLAAHRSRYWLAALVLSVGVLGKESVLFALPVLLISAYQRRELRSPATWIAMACPALVHLLLHRSPLWFGFVPPSYHYLSLETARWAVTAQLQWASIPKSVVSMFIYSFGFAWIMAAVGFSRADPFVRALSVYSALVLLSLLVTADWSRVGSFAFPGVIPLACAVEVRPRSIPLLVLAMAFLNFAVAFLPGGLLKYSLAAATLLAGIALVAADRGRRTASGLPEV